eukprot:jgi/Chrpa1/13499/Chrysochromulina_OHIO_Genome00019104-RA
MDSPTPPPPAPLTADAADTAAPSPTDGKAAGPSSVATAAAETAESIANPGYHYWHDKVAQGEAAAPKPEPKLLAAETTEVKGPAPKTLDSFAFLDDGEVVKVYISLEGDLCAVADEHVTATFHKQKFNDDSSMEVFVKGTSATHLLACPKLGGAIVPDECKWKINKKNKKLIVTLKKVNLGTAQNPHHPPWNGLRSNTALSGLKRW